MGHHEFKKKFTKPITEGQQQSAKPHQRKQMAAKLSVLHDLTAVSEESAASQPVGLLSLVYILCMQPGPYKVLSLLCHLEGLALVNVGHLPC